MVGSLNMYTLPGTMSVIVMILCTKRNCSQELEHLLNIITSFALCVVGSGERGHPAALAERCQCTVLLLLQ